MERVKKRKKDRDIIGHDPIEGPQVWPTFLLGLVVGFVGVVVAFMF